MEVHFTRETVAMLSLRENTIGTAKSLLITIEMSVVSNSYEYSFRRWGPTRHCIDWTRTTGHGSTGHEWNYASCRLDTPPVETTSH